MARMNWGACNKGHLGGGHYKGYSCTGTGTWGARPSSPTTTATFNPPSYKVVKHGTPRHLTTDEREQLKLQVKLAEKTGDLARYLNAKAALAAAC